MTAEEKIIQDRIRHIRDAWDDDTRFLRAHGVTNRNGPRATGLLWARDHPRVEMPRACGLHSRRKPMGSVVGRGYDQSDLYFEYIEHLMDHQES